MGEAEGLKASVQPAHLQISPRGGISPITAPCPQVHSWKWTPERPWPPLRYVTESPLYVLERYSKVREKLATPVPTPEITVAEGGYRTIDTHTADVEGERCEPSLSWPSPVWLGCSALRLWVWPLLCSLEGPVPAPPPGRLVLVWPDRPSPCTGRG